MTLVAQRWNNPRQDEPPPGDQLHSGYQSPC
jgi:hypothetical protein